MLGYAGVTTIRRMVLPDAAPEFARAAAQDGIVLEPRSFDWLTEQGHVALERVAIERRDPALRAPVTAALGVLAAVYARLRGDDAVLQASRANLLLGVDLVHEPSGTLIEVDECRHFNSFRLTALDLYPAGVQLGFDPEEHRQLCREWRASTDTLGRGLAAKAFGLGGLGRERAYQDALRDLATPAMGYPPLVRIVAPDGDGAAAYRRHGASLRRRLLA